MFSVSWYSASGSESATIPAPACTWASPSRTTMVRMAIAVSICAPPHPMCPTAPAYGPRAVGSSSSMISMARILGAPETVPAGKHAPRTSSADSPTLTRPSTWLHRCMTCE